MTTLLPPNATGLERAVETVIREVLDIDVPVAAFRDPARTPEARLPWFAWERHVDFWDDAWPEDVRRALVAGSFEAHRIAGTPAGDQGVLRMLGYTAWAYLEHLGQYRVDVLLLDAPASRSALTWNGAALTWNGAALTWGGSVVLDAAAAVRALRVLGRGSVEYDAWFGRVLTWNGAALTWGGRALVW